MKQFLILCINGALISVLGMVDTSFGNNMGVDAIIVFASWGTLYYLFHKIAMLGDCCYQCYPTRFTEGFIINIVMSILAGALMIVTSTLTSNLFEITQKQHELLIKCTVVYGFGIPISQTESIFNKHLVLTEKNKELIGATVVFYTAMIAWDAACLFLHTECYWLIVGTVTCNFITDLYYIIVCKCHKDFNRPDWHSVKELLSKGFFMWLERTGNAIAYVLASAIASYLGEMQYAIHSVCAGIAGATEDVTNCWCQNQIVRLQGKSVEDKFKAFKVERKKTFLPVILISLILALSLFIPMKGELPAGTTFKYLLLYLSQILFLCPYENYRGLLTSLGYTKCMPINMLIGTLFRLAYAYICIITPIGLIGFAFMISVCFTVRALMYTVAIKKKYNVLT
jgi:Na+-driven multidrug efflux pump